MGGSYGSDRRFDPGKPGNRIATDWVTAGSLNQTDLLVCARSLHRSGDRVRWRVPQVVWRGMGLNVQSGHSKVAVQACGPSFPLLQVFCCSYSRPLFLPLLPSLHILLLFPDRAMLVGQACQDVPRTRFSLFFFVSLRLLVFPSCLFSLSRVKNGWCFWGHGHLWQFLTLPPPSCPCLDCG